MMKSNDIIYNALIEYEETHRDELSSADYHKLNWLIERAIDDNFGYYLLDDAGYFGIKMWCEEDIYNSLSDLGYEPSQYNFDKVSATEMSRLLSDCADSDWQIISDCIKRGMGNV